MKIIELEDRIIYRADKNKKVKFIDSDVTYSEISVNKDDERVVVEVDSDV
jgi:hypothetical protein